MLLCLLVVETVHSHLCMLNPNQRGGFNITGGGNSACFRYKSPCGGQPMGAPQYTIQSGVPYPIQFQQNLNHFSIGHPGYLELSFSPKADPQLEADFTVLSAISDYYPYFQWTQTNFTKELVALLPKGFESEHSVIRVRYVPHKPSEPIFHQCADVRVVKPSQSGLRRGSNSKSYAVGLQFPSVTSNTNCALEVIDTDSGKTVVHFDLPFALRGGSSPSLSTHSGKASLMKLHNQIQFQSLLPSIVGVIATTDKQDTVYYMATSASLANLDSVPNILVKVQLNEQVGFPLVSYVPVSNLPSSNSHIVWLEYNPKQPTKLVAVVLVPSTTDRTTTFQVQNLDIVTGQLSSDYVVRLPAESTFVDFLHATLDADNQILYMLRRDEDALPTELTQRLYAVDLNQATVLRDIPLNSSQFAFSSIQYSSSYNGLLTFSAGPAAITASTVPYLTQVLINPVSGGFTALSTFKPPKNLSFNRVFKGALTDAMDESTKSFFQAVSVGPNANELVLAKSTNGNLSYLNIPMNNLFNTVILTK